MAETPKFEDGLAALEKLVAELEQGDLGLDEALKRFEKGVKLAAQMQAALEQSQRKVEQLAAGKLEPFGGDEAAGGDVPKKASK
ncbi:MAG TPA: exodeoxyribonuclease VII small subunit, partial [bacterium]|nr:exodeoxyribonuclease VII small subunit [bacterium]